MIEITRQQLKEDEVYNKLFEEIKKRHVVADHTIKVLLANKDIKDFCEEARHFGILPSSKGNQLYLHYDVSSWYHPSGAAQVKIDAVGVYDDFMEYEVARVKQLHGAGNADIPNIN